MNMKNNLTAISLPALMVVLSGCAVAPAPFSQTEMHAIVDQDRSAITSRLPEFQGELTLEEAIARALKYNLEHRTRMLEQGYAAGVLDASKFDMLPRLMANAGYSWRDKDLTRDAVDSVTGQPSLSNPYISSDRRHTTEDLTFSWSLLDFGASYYTAKQNADRVLIASEHRRKAMHLLIQNVRTEFWRVVAAEKLQAQVKNTIAEAESALDESRQIEAERIKSPMEALRYQRALLENLRLLENVDRELSAARISLASLVGLMPGTPIHVVEPEGALVEPQMLGMPIEHMEELALTNNADLREQFYNARIAAVETRKTLLKLFPGISFEYGAKHDNDSYLVHQSWREAGVSVGFNLFSLLSAPAQMNAAEKGKALAEARRMALQMAVLTQVHLARREYEDALQQYRRANMIWDVDNRLAELTSSREVSKLASQQERVSAQVTAILSQLRRYHALAKAHEAASKIEASLGLEPAIGSLDDVDLPDLAQRIGDYLRQEGEAGGIAQPAEAANAS
jgi:outer membrane protein TolC